MQVGTFPDRAVSPPTPNVQVFLAFSQNSSRSPVSVSVIARVEHGRDLRFWMSRFGGSASATAYK
jgi:hypothetical protein